MMRYAHINEYALSDVIVLLKAGRDEGLSEHGRGLVIPCADGTEINMDSQDTLINYLETELLDLENKL